MNNVFKVLAVCGGLFALSCWKVWYVDNDDIRPAYLRDDIKQIRIAVAAYGIPLGPTLRPWREPPWNKSPETKD